MTDLTHLEELKIYTIIILPDAVGPVFRKLTTPVTSISLLMPTAQPMQP